MPFYMFQGSYTPEAIKAMTENPHDRGAAAAPLIEALGGRLHNFFFCMGSDDVVAIIEAPDDNAVLAMSAAVGGSGAMSAGRTTKLLSSADAVEAMVAAGKAVSGSGYSPATG